MYKPQPIQPDKIRSKTVLLRTDYNCLNEETGKVNDPLRIYKSLETLKYLLSKGARRVVLMTHIGRPDSPNKFYSTEKIIPSLVNYLGEDPALKNQVLEHYSGPINHSAKNFISNTKARVILLENLRFHPGEKARDEDFARELRRLGDVYVNEAFSCCHNKDASITQLPLLFSPEYRFAGFNLIDEIALMEEALSRPKEGYVLIVGGSKVESKLPTILNLQDRVEKIILGGKIALSVLKAQGKNVYNTRVESDEQVEALEKLVGEHPDKYCLPVDFRGIAEFDAEGHILHAEHLDVGSHTISQFVSLIKDAKTIVHAGPLGYLESETFSIGTKDLAYAVAEMATKLGEDGFALAGGGDTLSVYSGLPSLHLEGFNLIDEIYASTGGGAMLNYLAGKPMPGLEALVTEEKSEFPKKSNDEINEEEPILLQEVIE